MNEEVDQDEDIHEKHESQNDDPGLRSMVWPTGCVLLSLQGSAEVLCFGLLYSGYCLILFKCRVSYGEQQSVVYALFVKELGERGLPSNQQKAHPA